MFDPLKEHAIEEIKNRGHDIKDPWDAVDLFEKTIAEYAGSRYAVAVDNCTNAIFLCLKYLRCDAKKQVITVPKRTYASVPMIIHNANCKYTFRDISWTGLYQLKPYPIYDSALRFTKNMYVKDSFQCLSFHRKKILKLMKGGMILTNSLEASEWFKSARHSGRHLYKGTFYKDDSFKIMGWNMYMHPEYAARGLLIFEQLPEKNLDVGGSEIYSDLIEQPMLKLLQN
jgi:dTDP-4-amino-4,6-dideoxygalactose transaminase